VRWRAGQHLNLHAGQVSGKSAFGQAGNQLAETVIRPLNKRLTGPRKCETLGADSCAG
jgi:hypothetical protein